MKVQCCVCKRVRQEDEKWAREGKARVQPNSVSHGYCPRCAARVLAEIRAQHGLLKGLRTA